VELQGKVTVVTGSGGTGTGRAISEHFASEGALIVVADVDDQGSQETVRLIEEDGGRAAWVRTDVTEDSDLEAMISFAVETFGGLDVLVNNAGGTPEPHFPDAPLEHWRKTVALNLTGPMTAVQHALEPMRERGGGAIVNVSSVAGVGYQPHDSPEYAAAKAGLIRLSAVLAPLAGRWNIRVNCVIPHWIRTPEVLEEIDTLPPEERAKVPELTPPAEIAEAVLELVRDDALAGRVMICWCGEPRRLIPNDRRE
jgi:NAD(P)-dependent dehydrogenase (short-subunit alcohol dehydrogenase family)